MINELLNTLLDIAQNPDKQIEKYKAEGKKLSGIFPEYAPEPIVAAAGFIPVGMWGKDYLVIKNADVCFPNFGCSLMRSNVELGLTGYADNFSFIIAPILCDAQKGAVQCFRTRVKTPVIPFSLPQNRSCSGSADFTAAEYKALAQKIQALTGVVITDEAIEKQIEIYNKHNLTMRKFINLAAMHTDVITPVIRMAVFKSARLMSKEEHTEYLVKINDELEKSPETRKNKTGVIFTGINSGSWALMRLFEELKIDILADSVCEDSWGYSADIPAADSPYKALALQWNNISGACICHEKRGPRYEQLKELAQKTNANGLVISLMKFCDPDEYEAVPLVNNIKADLPVLIIESDQNSDNTETIRTRLEAFTEIIG